MEKLGSLRQEIDAADEALTRAFVERMHVSEKIAEAKEEAGLPVSDPEREREKIARILESVPEDTRSYAKALYYPLFDLSKAKQEEHQASESLLTAEIDRAIREAAEYEATDGQRKAYIDARSEADTLIRQVEVAYKEKKKTIDSGARHQIKSSLSYIKKLVSRTKPGNVSEEQAAELQRAAAELRSAAGVLGI